MFTHLPSYLPFTYLPTYRRTDGPTYTIMHSTSDARLKKDLQRFILQHKAGAFFCDFWWVQVNGKGGKSNHQSFCWSKPCV